MSKILNDNIIHNYVFNFKNSTNEHATCLRRKKITDLKQQKIRQFFQLLPPFNFPKN